MVEAKPLEQQFEELMIEGGDPEMIADIRKIMNDPKYMETAEQEIETMLGNAKCALT